MRQHSFDCGSKFVILSFSLDVHMCTDGMHLMCVLQVCRDPLRALPLLSRGLASTVLGLETVVDTYGILHPSRNL